MVLYNTKYIYKISNNKIYSSKLKKICQRPFFYHLAMSDCRYHTQFLPKILRALFSNLFNVFDHWFSIK